ncbi:endonuclease [Rufibacter roseus]|uniref:Endonuclease n=1 Tax=Rufibacter roseus TaxID=1567108 RepID=A0ABW2DL67_9BACT|nr:endonuclease [Rufibacter roseus]
MNKHLRSLLMLFLVTLAGFSSALAQTAPPSNLSGTELRAWLRQNWYEGKRQVLSYSYARGKMYNYIDNYNNKVEGVYSGYEQPFQYSETNTSTSIPNINCEHTVPQSWFDEAERMRTDIHHLFPTVIQWNSDRGSDPFAEIPDSQTQKWIINLTSQTSIPTTNIDAYSEDTNSQFEPREVHKGNVARAIFYFYTMHEGQRFDPGKGVPSAVGDMQTLYQWHLQDPVDARELERNNRIQRVQGNRNPFIDYPELVASAWGFTPVNCSPATQVSQLSLTEATQTSFKINWTNGSGNRRLVVVREGSASAFSPSGSYSTGVNSDFSQATDQGNGHKLVYAGTGNSVTVTGLTANRTYYVQVFEYCSTNNTYNTTGAPAAQVTLPDYTCSGVPSQRVSGLTTSEVGTGGFTLSFTSGNGDGRLVLVREGSAPTATPQAGTSYTNANLNFSSAPALSDGSKVVYIGSGNSISVIGLKSNTEYYAVAFESCSNGWQYGTGSTALSIRTEQVGGNLPSGVVARQDFEHGADDGWAVTSGFSSSSDNSGYPDNQRIASGTKSFQQIPPATGVTTTNLVFESINTTNYNNLAVEIFNSSVSISTGNGMDAGDFVEAYVALNGADFSATPDAKITAGSAANVRYGMNGTGVVETTAGTPVTKTIALTGDISGDEAPSRIIVRIPNGTTSVQLKIVVQNNATNEVLNIDDVTLYGTSSVTGVPQALEDQLQVYPNPTTGVFTVKTPSSLKVLEASVYNSVAQRVATQKTSSAKNSVTFNLQHQPKGIYLVQLRTDKGTVVRRLLVQ